MCCEDSFDILNDYNLKSDIFHWRWETSNKQTDYSSTIPRIQFCSSELSSEILTGSPCRRPCPVIESDIESTCLYLGAQWEFPPVFLRNVRS